MSGSINKVILIGVLERDPEIKTLPDGSITGNINIVTNEIWTNKDGQTREKAERHRLSVWGKMAENCGKYLAKGRCIYVEGKLRTRSWEDQKSGSKKWITEVYAKTVKFIGGTNDVNVTSSSFNIGVNKVMLVGWVSQNPEMRYTQSGMAVADFTLETDEWISNSSGELQKYTERHKIVVWGKQAESCNRFLNKNKAVYVEGRLRTNSWEDQNGVTKEKVEIVAQSVHFLEKMDSLDLPQNEDSV
jgi:single-strand DNA-binding protein